MLVAVTGATGLIGRSLVEALLSEGHQVRVLCRNPHALPKEFANHESINVFKGDILHEESLEEFLAGVECIFHLAAEMDMYPKDKQKVWRVNVDGTRLAIDVLQGSSKSSLATCCLSANESLSMPSSSMHPLC
jgi:dihydroflavonol-4-reductase